MRKTFWEEGTSYLRPAWAVGDGSVGCCPGRSGLMSSLVKYSSVVRVSGDQR